MGNYQFWLALFLFSSVLRHFQTFMPLQYCDNGERQCPGFTSETRALFRIKDLLHFEYL